MRFVGTSEGQENVKPPHPHHFLMCRGGAPSEVPTLTDSERLRLDRAVEKIEQRERRLLKPIAKHA